MNSRSKALELSRLYVIVNPRDPGPLPLEALVRETVSGGADIIQLRDKDAPDEEMVERARALSKIAHDHGALFIVNDRIRVARDAGADGVHLGQDDPSILEARKILSEGSLVGKSTHSIEQALRAQDEGADYLGLGPIFATPTKPGYAAIGIDIITQAGDMIRIPFFVIGGIDHENLGEVLRHGASRVAVVRAVVRDDPRAASRRFKARLELTSLPIGRS